MGTLWYHLTIYVKYTYCVSDDYINSIGSSVESLVYLTEGSDKTQAQINNTPHLHIVQLQNESHLIQVMSVIAILVLD